VGTRRLTSDSARAEKGSIISAWDNLPLGARVALEQQWEGLVAGGLACGSSILNADGKLLAAGCNRAYDPATKFMQASLQTEVSEILGCV